MVTFLGGNYERYPDVIQRDAVWNYAGLDPGVSPGNGYLSLEMNMIYR